MSPFDSPAHRSGLLEACLLLCLVLLPALATSTEPPDRDVRPPELREEESSNHWHMNTAFGIRAVPVGTALTLDGGYRMGLFDSDSVLLKDTYLEAGATVDSSPSYFWGGAYIEAVPLAVLELRLEAQSTQYFGTFGYLHLPDDPDKPDWSLDTLGGAAGEGTPGSGYRLEAKATLRAKVGNVVALVPSSFTHISVDVGQTYYESTLDMLLESTDQMWAVTPTLGYVLVMEDWDSWVLTGARWEHAESLQTELSRDMPAGLALWKLPSTLAGGEMKLVAVGGYWLNHPNRSGTPYFASQFSVDWLF